MSYFKLYVVPAIAAAALFFSISTPGQQKDATKLNLECAVECAKAGSPLIVLTKDGVIYTPISDTMPDKDQRQRLMPFLGKYVQVTGTVSEREGTHAIAVQNIKEMKEVHLITNAK